MYQTLNEFLHIWQNEYDRTQRIMSTLTDQSLSYEVTSEDRTLGHIAWHIVLSVHHIVSRTGLEFEAPSDNEPVPAAAMEMADTYRRVSENFILALKANWSDASLLQLNEVSPGEKWENRMHLLWLINHQIHHRGQLTVLMRQAGLRVPGVYGPSKEELVELGIRRPRT